ncbi:MAG TPA: hypothetical protein VJZ76_19250 [Thermoanaerobaculia bacterium]|nr:hypothetical protein [Thermoanaerobaculia bacterium]
MFVLITGLMLYLAPASAANQPVTATLELVPATTLPGTPVAFMVAAYNPNDSVHTLWDFARLTVTTPTSTFDANGLLNGRSFIAIPPEQMDRCSGVACLQLPAHGQRQLYIDIGPTLAGNEFFADHRLSEPGVYTLQLALEETAGDGKPIEIRTNLVTLTIQQPRGVDLAVWQFLQQASGGKGWGTTEWILGGNNVANEIRAKYASSSYLPWVAAMGNVTTPGSTLAQLDAALATGPPPSLRDDLLLVKGSFAAQSSGHSLETDRDIDKALVFADVARSAFSLLRDLAISDVMRRRAADALTHLYSRRTAEEMLRQLSAIDPPAPLKLIPRVECVTPGQGNTFTARFGYTNPNQVLKVIPLGAENQITPAPRGDAQPRVFRPGDHANVFEANSPGGVLTWHLDKNVATATADFGARCVEPALAAQQPSQH